MKGEQTLRLFFVSLMIAIVGCWHLPCEAAFEASEGQRSIVIGEISSYEGKTLKQEFYDLFYDMLTEEIQVAKELKAIYRENLHKDETNRMKLLHMDAIISCGDFNPKEANELLLYYARGVEHPLSRNNPVVINTRGYSNLAAFSEIDLLLFVNVTKVEVASKTLNRYQGTKSPEMKLKMHYVFYLVDRHKGLIYNKHQSASEANGYGYNFSQKTFTLQDLFKMAVKNASQNIMNDVRKVSL